MSPLRRATWWPATLAGRLSVVLAAFILLGTAVVLGVEYVRGRDALLRDATQRLTARDRLIVDRLEGALQARLRLVSLWPQLGSSQDLAIDDLDKRLAASLVQLAGSFATPDTAFAIAPGGRIVAASTAARIGGSAAAEPWFQAARSPRAGAVLRLVRQRVGWTLVASSPVHATATGRLLGWVVLTTRWPAIVAEAAGDEGRALVVRAGDGRVISRGGLAGPDSAAFIWVARRTADVAGLRLDAAMAFPRAEALRPLRDTGRELGLVAVVVLALTLPASLVLVRSTTAELRRLTSAAHAVPEHPEPGALAVSGAAPREVRVLADALATMVRRLEESRRALARQESLAAMGTMAAGLAHEIRTPLSVLRGSAQMLSKRARSGSRDAELVSFMLDEVERLGRLVDDLLVFARPRRPDLGPADLADVARRATDALRPRFAEQGLTLDAGLDAAPVRGDAQQLYQVALNLLTNAARASREGQRIEVATGRAGSVAMLRVRDEGRGIPEDQLKRIWDPFYTTGNGGTGLGLPIVRHIVEEHGGEITLDSQVGAGTVATVRLPAVDAEAAT